MTALVQVESYRGFALKIDPSDQGEMPDITVVNILTGETLGTVVTSMAAVALVDSHLRGP